MRIKCGGTTHTYYTGTDQKAASVFIVLKASVNMCPREMLFAKAQFHGLKSQLLLHPYFVCFSFIPSVMNFNQILIL